MSLFRMEKGWPVPQGEAETLCQGLKWERVDLTRLRTVNPATGEEVADNVIAYFSMEDRLIIIEKLEDIETRHKREAAKLIAFFGQSRGAKALVLAYRGHVVTAIVTDYDHQRAVITAIAAEENARHQLAEAHMTAMASIYD